MQAINIILGRHGTATDAHGAKELEIYLRRMLGSVPIACFREGRGNFGKINFLIGQTEKSDALLKTQNMPAGRIVADGYALLVAREGGRIFIVCRGGRGRGTLYGIYAFLEKQGCRFFEPFYPGEVIPKRDGLDLTEFAEVRNPSLPLRSYDLDLIVDWNIVEINRLLDWAVKNRLNTVVLVVGRNDFLRLLPAIKTAALERDLTLGVGGHQIFAWLMLAEKMLKAPIPAWSSAEVIAQYRRLLGQHPGWCRNKERHALCDPCLTNAGVLKRLVKNTAVFLKAHPEFTFLHFKPSDGFDNAGHCRCRKCLPPRRIDTRDGEKYQSAKNHLSDVYFEAVRKIAAALLKVRPEVTVGHTFPLTFGEPVLYAGNRRPEEMPANVKYFYACLESQSFAFPLFAPEYPRSWLTGVTHGEMLDSIAALLAGGGADRRLVVKEMHGSGAFSGLSRNTPHVIAENMRRLEKMPGGYAGSKLFTNLKLQDHASAWHSFGLNLYLYCRLAWDTAAAVDGILSDFHEKYYGTAAGPMRKAYDIIEKNAAQLIFKPFNDHLMDRQLLPETISLSSPDLPFYRRHLKQTLGVRKLCRQALALAADRETADRIARDLKAFEYLVNMLNLKVKWLEAKILLDAALREKDRIKNRRHLDQCGVVLEQAHDFLRKIIRAGIEGRRGMQNAARQYEKLKNAWSQARGANAVMKNKRRSKP